MKPKSFHIDVVGLMSGTSLDGLDLCCVHFDFDGAWRYRIVKAESVDYPASLREKLATAQSMSALDYARLHSDYGLYLGEQVRDFVARNGLKVDLVASHGQTIFHQPGVRFTAQTPMDVQRLSCDRSIPNVTGSAVGMKEAGSVPLSHAPSGNGGGRIVSTC